MTRSKGLSQAGRVDRDSGCREQWSQFPRTARRICFFLAARSRLECRGLLRVVAYADTSPILQAWSHPDTADRSSLPYSADPLRSTLPPCRLSAPSITAGNYGRKL